MIRIEGRFEVRVISSQAFAQYMKHRGFSVRSLADALGGPHLRSTIGHLRSGKRPTCDPDLARRIEKILDAPKDSLFVPIVSRVAREVAPLGKAS
jgi:hypothetical protein